MHFLLIPYALLSLSFVVHFLERRDAYARSGLVLTAGITTTLIFLALLLRPVIGDSWRYYQYFLVLRNMELQDAFNYQSESDPLYVLLNWTTGQLGDSQWLLFGATLLIFIGMFLLSVYKLAGPIGASILLMCYMGYPFFIAYASSGLRQGLSLVFLLMAFVGFRQQKLTAWAWLLLAPFWHSGAWLGVGVTVLHQAMCQSVSSGRMRWALVLGLLFVAVGLSASGLNESIMSALPELISLRQTHEIYFNNNEEIAYRTGFRADFFLFSLLPLITGWLLRKKAPIFSYMGSGWWLSLYLSLNIIYHLFSFVPFADRFSAFSWFLLPLVILLQVIETRSRKILVYFVGTIMLINVIMLQLYTGSFIRMPEGW
ncbi:EpsG family protein [Methylobacter sp. Wu1]|uniref:EpsG family protein n=1 Tax=Methylobacter sp. Wu1 TaxID=3119359 RepID=UPI002F94715A